MRIVVLAGGIGGARFLLGVRAWAGQSGSEVTAVVNVGDDVTLHGLRICPDLDSVMYTLGGGSDPERGWGRANETWTVKEELAAYGADPTWFGLGDRDVATHLVRTRMLGAGYPLSAVTEALCARWQPGVTAAAGIGRPGRDPRRGAGAGRDALPGVVGALPRRAAGAAVRVRRRRHGQARRRRAGRSGRGGRGAARAEQPGGEHRPDPGRDRSARGAVAGRAPVVGVSPIIGGSPVRGMADKCLAALDVECSAAGVAGLYGARGAGGVLDGWLVDPADAETTLDGATVRATPLWMTDEDGHGGDGARSPRRGRGDRCVRRYRSLPVTGIGRIVPGDDLAEIITAAAPWLRDGDVLVVTSKIVSKAEGQLVEVPEAEPEREAAREQILAEQTARPVARRGQTAIVATHHGFVMAAAGIDNSNVDPSQLVLLPKDPDASARALRADAGRAVRPDGRRHHLRHHGPAVAQSASPTWRSVRPASPRSWTTAGEVDPYGNELHLTQMAVIDELAAAAELVKGKCDGVPVAVVRGYLGQPPAEDGPGAQALIRDSASDLFSLGTAEARAAGLADAATPADAPCVRSGGRWTRSWSLAHWPASVLAASTVVG